MKVVEIINKKEDTIIVFDDGSQLSAYHDSDCCERHWLGFEDLTLFDFEGLDFDLQNNGFFERIEGYGIALLPINGHPVRIPGYGSNNGYYSEKLNLKLKLANGEIKEYDISECQSINY